MDKHYTSKLLPKEAVIPSFDMLELQIDADGNWSFDEDALIIFLLEVTHLSEREIAVILLEDIIVRDFILAWYQRWRSESGENIVEMDIFIRELEVNEPYLGVGSKKLH